MCESERAAIKSQSLFVTSVITQTELFSPFSWRTFGEWVFLLIKKMNQSKIVNTSPLTRRLSLKTFERSSPQFGSIAGRLFGAAGEQPFIGSTLSSAFPLVNHPAFGAIYTAGAGRPEFGGLGSLGMSAALAAHPQLGALSGKMRTFYFWAATGPKENASLILLLPLLSSSSEWWRAAEAHGRGAAAFLPSFIGFPPFFTPHIQPNHSASPVQIRMPGKNSHISPKGTEGPPTEINLISNSQP